ncbi:MAG: CoA-binding protein [Planctomycetes bacterium]|nr:CoA-binding protein [Planctomycetota bacterium]
MDMCEILKTSKRVAVLGASANPSRTAFGISSFLRRAGLEVIPVNPQYAEIQGERCVPSLREIAAPVDIVDVFRAAEHEDEVADEILAMKHKPRAVWFQLNAGGEGVRERLEEAGIVVFVDHCIMVDYSNCQ